MPAGSQPLCSQEGQAAHPVLGSGARQGRRRCRGCGRWGGSVSPARPPSPPPASALACHPLSSPGILLCLLLILLAACQRWSTPRAEDLSQPSAGQGVPGVPVQPGHTARPPSLTGVLQLHASQLAAPSPPAASCIFPEQSNLPLPARPPGALHPHQAL